MCAEQYEDWLRGDGGHIAALLVEPFCVAHGRYAVADEGETRRAEGDEFVRIDGQVAWISAAEGCFGGAVFHEVSRHPVVFAAGEAFYGFAEVAAIELCATFAGRADEAHGETGFKGERNERCFAVAGDALDAYVFCVDGWVGFEV